MPHAEPPDDLDIHEAGFVRDPYPTYDALRRQCPVAHSTHYGGFWLLMDYDDVRQAAMDWRTYTSSVPGVTAIPLITPRTEPQLPLELDPPLHSRYRALVNPVFARERIDALRPTVEDIAEALLDAALARRDCDLVADYAIPLSVGALAAFTGLPAADSGQWVAWIRRMFDVHQPGDAQAASAEFSVYINDLIAARKQAPVDDFISLLLASEVDGQRLTDAELHAFCTLLFGAGFETTADALSVTLLHLAEQPADLRRLAHEPSLIPTAIEEFLRFTSPIQIFGRNVTRDVDLHGQRIGQGDVVALGFGAANHDPAVFPQPERCQIDRAPNRHVAFGAGPHLCLGAPVARLELAVTLALFARRVESMALLPGRAPQWKTRGDRRGLAALPVTLAGTR
jgi:cytochrome P450